PPGECLDGPGLFRELVPLQEPVEPDQVHVEDVLALDSARAQYVWRLHLLQKVVELLALGFVEILLDLLLQESNVARDLAEDRSVVLALQRSENLLIDVLATEVFGCRPNRDHRVLLIDGE